MSRRTPIKEFSSEEYVDSPVPIRRSTRILSGQTTVTSSAPKTISTRRGSATSIDKSEVTDTSSPTREKKNRRTSTDSETKPTPIRTRRGSISKMIDEEKKVSSPSTPTRKNTRAVSTSPSKSIDLPARRTRRSLSASQENEDGAEQLPVRRSTRRRSSTDTIEYSTNEDSVEKSKPVTRRRRSSSIEEPEKHINDPRPKAKRVFSEDNQLEPIEEQETEVKESIDEIIKSPSKDKAHNLSSIKESGDESDSTNISDLDEVFHRKNSPLIQKPSSLQKFSGKSIFSPITPKTTNSKHQTVEVSTEAEENNAKIQEGADSTESIVEKSEPTPKEHSLEKLQKTPRDDIKSNTESRLSKVQLEENEEKSLEEKKQSSSTEPHTKDDMEESIKIINDIDEVLKASSPDRLGRNKQRKSYEKQSEIVDVSEKSEDNTEPIKGTSEKSQTVTPQSPTRNEINIEKGNEVQEILETTKPISSPLKRKYQSLKGDESTSDNVVDHNTKEFSSDSKVTSENIFNISGKKRVTSVISGSDDSFSLQMDMSLDKTNFSETHEETFSSPGSNKENSVCNIPQKNNSRSGEKKSGEESITNKILVKEVLTSKTSRKSFCEPMDVDETPPWQKRPSKISESVTKETQKEADEKTSSSESPMMNESLIFDEIFNKNGEESECTKVPDVERKLSPTKTLNTTNPANMASELSDVTKTVSDEEKSFIHVNSFHSEHENLGSPMNNKSRELNEEERKSEEIDEQIDTDTSSDFSIKLVDTDEEDEKKVEKQPDVTVRRSKRPRMSDRVLNSFQRKQHSKVKENSILETESSAHKTEGENQKVEEGNSRRKSNTRISLNKVTEIELRDKDCPQKENHDIDVENQSLKTESSGRKSTSRHSLQKKSDNPDSNEERSKRNSKSRQSFDTKSEKVREDAEEVPANSGRKSKSHQSLNETYDDEDMEVSVNIEANKSASDQENSRKRSSFSDSFSSKDRSVKKGHDTSSRKQSSEASPKEDADPNTKTDNSTNTENVNERETMEDDPEEEQFSKPDSPAESISPLKSKLEKMKACGVNFVNPTPTKPKVKLDKAMSDKLDDFLSKKLVNLVDSDVDSDTNNESGDRESEDSPNEFLDDMAMEGEEDTPSEGSNDIIDDGESINTTESECDTDDTYDRDDPFIVEDEETELLSGSEYDTDPEDTSSTAIGDKTKKRQRIIESQDSSSDDDKVEIIEKKEIEDDKPVKRISIKMNKSLQKNPLNKNTVALSSTPRTNSPANVDFKEEQIEKTLKSPSSTPVSPSKSDSSVTPVIAINLVEDSSGEEETQGNVQEKSAFEVKLTSLVDPVQSSRNNSFAETNNSSVHNNSVRSSSIIVHENMNISAVQDGLLADKLQQVVKVFCAGIRSSDGNISMNVSLDYTENSPGPSVSSKTNVENIKTNSITELQNKSRISLNNSNQAQNESYKVASPNTSSINISQRNEKRSSQLQDETVLRNEKEMVKSPNLSYTNTSQERNVKRLSQSKFETVLNVEKEEVENKPEQLLLNKIDNIQSKISKKKRKSIKAAKRLSRSINNEIEEKEDSVFEVTSTNLNKSDIPEVKTDAKESHSEEECKSEDEKCMEKTKGASIKPSKKKRKHIESVSVSMTPDQVVSKRSKLVPMKCEDLSADDLRHRLPSRNELSGNRDSKMQTKKLKRLQSKFRRDTKSALLSGLLTDVKHRPRRLMKPTVAMNDESWVVDEQFSKPSATMLPGCGFNFKKLDAKDFKNQMLYDPRIKREETSKLLRKKGYYL